MQQFEKLAGCRCETTEFLVPRLTKIFARFRCMWKLCNFRLMHDKKPIEYWDKALKRGPLIPNFFSEYSKKPINLYSDVFPRYIKIYKAL